MHNDRQKSRVISGEKLGLTGESLGAAYIALCGFGFYAGCGLLDYCYTRSKVTL
jgi:hypothetical protein